MLPGIILVWDSVQTPRWDRCATRKLQRSTESKAVNICPRFLRHRMKSYNSQGIRLLSCHFFANYGREKPLVEGCPEFPIPFFPAKEIVSFLPHLGNQKTTTSDKRVVSVLPFPSPRRLRGQKHAVTGVPRKTMPRDDSKPLGFETLPDGRFVSG